MAYTKKNLEVHSRIARLYEKYHDKDFIHFKKGPDIKGTRYLETLIRAIEQKQVIRLYYMPFYEDKPYFNDVHPYLLKEHEFRWYLVAWNQFKNQVRTYALDRVRDIQVNTDAEYRKPGFNPSTYFDYTIGIISPPGAPPLIKLAVQLTQAQYLITQPWHESQNIESEDEDQVIFSFRVHPTYEFKSRLLSLGKDAEVLEPDVLRQELQEELQSMLKKYYF